MPQWHFPTMTVHKCFNPDWTSKNYFLRSNREEEWENLENFLYTPYTAWKYIFNKLLQKICFINKIEKT